MARQKRHRVSPPIGPLPPKIDAAAEELARVILNLKPSVISDFPMIYRCLGCQRVVSYPETLYRDDRCMHCTSYPVY